LVQLTLTVKKLAHALSSQSLGQNSYVEIFWKSEKGNFRENNIKLMDFPGLNFNKAVDVYIEKYCQDADVYVLVVDSEKGITNTVCTRRGYNMLIHSLIFIYMYAYLLFIPPF